MLPPLVVCPVAALIEADSEWSILAHYAADNLHQINLLLSGPFSAGLHYWRDGNRLRRIYLLNARTLPECERDKKLRCQF
jgi:hypothetical protein